LSQDIRNKVATTVAKRREVIMAISLNGGTTCTKLIYVNFQLE
jgi:hypothetical protein